LPRDFFVVSMLKLTVRIKSAII